MKNRKIHDWTKSLVLHANSVGIRATDPVFNRSRKGYYSAYFGVPGLGEVRVSDHPMERSRSTADVSISSPSTYIDLAKAFVFKHNEVMGTDLTVIAQPPYIIGSVAGADIIRSLEEAQAEKEAARTAMNAYVSARTTWWAARVAESGLEGTHGEIKHQLKRQGVRYPSDAAEENGDGN